MEQLTTIELIKVKTEELSVDTVKFYKGNKSAGTRARKLAQELKSLLQTLRTEILEDRKVENND
jgi:hypothetical protein